MKTTIRVCELAPGRWGLETNRGNRLSLADGAAAPADGKLAVFEFDRKLDADIAAARWNMELAKQADKKSKGNSIRREVGDDWND